MLHFNFRKVTGSSAATYRLPYFWLSNADYPQSRWYAGNLNFIFVETSTGAGKLFVLGGGQPGAFTVSGKNVGPVPVTVQERRADGSVQERGTLTQGQQTKLDFPNGSTALLLNSSTKLAVLSLDISSIRGLGMRYEGLK